MPPDMVECWACRGHGHFSRWGKPSADKRDRKCLECSGEGKIPESPPEPCPDCCFLECRCEEHETPEREAMTENERGFRPHDSWCRDAEDPDRCECGASSYNRGFEAGARGEREKTKTRAWHVAVLREVLGNIWNAWHKYSGPTVEECIGHAKSVLRDTEAAAREFTERIQRETIERCAEAIRDALTTGLLTPGNVTQALRSLERLSRALGTKEGNDA